MLGLETIMEDDIRCYDQNSKVKYLLQINQTAIG
ncbi:hypothetical protein HME9304_03307 [Flagellimonas maritima]|uniref:Uncharacterized protein n=1 Tax=Flagellimonas maritima TaxID=1383885 RepID=A0A2Z4LWB9_9FLAO|nr:hypothetical protein HME9304_03307 [Allomuricauda aurantiaca]